MSHSHKFDNWPFDVPIATAALTTRHVVEETLPVLLVYRDPDGWQFLCGTTTAQEDGRVVCMGCMMELDPSLMQVAHLPIGWQAERKAVGRSWTWRAQEKYFDEDDEDDEDD